MTADSNDIVHIRQPYIELLGDPGEKPVFNLSDAARAEFAERQFDVADDYNDTIAALQQRVGEALQRKIENDLILGALVPQQPVHAPSATTPSAFAVRRQYSPT
jgi:hypothetical protein